MYSIFCEALDGECFESHKCAKCKYKKPELLDNHTSKRIADNANIAIYALEGLLAAAPYIHQDYLKEKLTIVRKCLMFMENYEKEE